MSKAKDKNKLSLQIDLIEKKSSNKEQLVELDIDDF